MEVSVQSVVEEAIRFEHNLAALYLLFSSSMPEDADLWWELSTSEKEHATILEASQKLFGDEFARETVPADLELLRSSNETLEASIDRFERDAPTREDALRLALRLESDENEATLFRLLDVSTSRPAQDVVERIHREDQSHAAKIRDYAKRHGVKL
jgi:hypothetical protein